MSYCLRSNGDRYAKPADFSKNENLINGLLDYKLIIKRNFSPKDASMVHLVSESENSTRVNLTDNFKPGCIVSLK